MSDAPQAPSTPPATTTAEPASGSKSPLWTVAIALGIVVAIVAFVLFGLGDTSLLPMNYRGFDGKSEGK